jgi:hypothetical protein
MATAACLLTVAAGAPRPASADVEIINRNGFTLNFSFQGALAGFSVSNIDYGVGNLDTDLSRRRTSRAWGEAFAQPGLNGQLTTARLGTFYFGVSVITSVTFGDGDAISGLAPQGSRSTTSLHQGWTMTENAFGGWRSANLFPSLGTDAFDISGGYQSFTIGDGLVIGDGTNSGWGRGAYYLDPRGAFHDTAILRFSPSAIAPVRAAAFMLSSNTNQLRMFNNDQAQSRLAGGMLEWYAAAPQGTEDHWRVTGTYFNIYSADTNPALCFVNFACSAPATTANRDGLNVFSIRAGGSFFENRDIKLYGEFVYQLNNRTNRRVRAYGWYLEGGYRFSSVPWSPMVSYRYAQFSGDSNPGDGTDKSYDPLFSASGLRGTGPGTWYLGEIYGYYLGTISNINVNQFHVRASPTSTLNIGLLYYLADFNEPAQFGATSNGAFHEIDVYAAWTPLPWLTVTPTFAVNIPRDGYRQIARNAVVANGQPATTATDRNIYLFQAVVAVSF